MGVADLAREVQSRLGFGAASNVLSFEALEVPPAEIQFRKCSRPAEVALYLFPGDVVSDFRQCGIERRYIM